MKLYMGFNKKSRKEKNSIIKKTAAMKCSWSGVDSPELPIALRKYLKLVNRLEHDEEPDYDKLRRCFAL